MQVLMFQAGVKGMSGRIELIPCLYIYILVIVIACNVNKPCPRAAPSDSVGLLP